jgi:zinc D-Ala-D-Ala carboxypeptidase
MVSQAAARSGLKNVPTGSALANLERLVNQLELVRAALRNLPILISSGFRSSSVNALIGGAEGSAHTKGLAADFICPAFGAPKAVCQQIVDAGIAFDQLIHEGTWVHFAIAAPSVAPRRQVLTAIFAARQPNAKPAVRYVSGLV